MIFLSKRNKDETTERFCFRLITFALPVTRLLVIWKYITRSSVMDEEFVDILRVTSVYKNGKLLYAVSQLVDVIQPFPSTLKENTTKSQLLDTNCCTHLLLTCIITKSYCMLSCNNNTRKRSRLLHTRFLHK